MDVGNVSNSSSVCVCVCLSVSVLRRLKQPSHHSDLFLLTKALFPSMSVF